MKVERIICGDLLENCYIIYIGNGDDDTHGKNDCYIIDPGDSCEEIISFVKANKLKVQALLLTHHHYDHTRAVNLLLREYDCPVYIHRKDRPYVNFIKEPLPFSDNQEFQLGNHMIKVLHSPGHTKGSVCLYAEDCNMCFTGDTIFDTDLGRTDLMDGSVTEMEDTIVNVVSKWPDQVTIYPGHDEKATMKMVRKYNTEYLEIINDRKN